MTTVEDQSGATRKKIATTPQPEDQIGTRIAQKRTAKGLNHDGLSKLTKLCDNAGNVGIGRTTIRGYEIGTYKPGTRELRLLSQALEVSVDWLIFGAGDEDAQSFQGRNDANLQVSSEFGKFLVGLYLLAKLEPKERDSVYGVMHALARLRQGENEYRAGIVVIEGVTSLILDHFADTANGVQVDHASFSKIAKASIPLLDDFLEKEFGMSAAIVFDKIEQEIMRRQDSDD